MPFATNDPIASVSWISPFLSGSTLSNSQKIEGLKMYVAMTARFVLGRLGFSSKCSTLKSPSPMLLPSMTPYCSGLSTLSTKSAISAPFEKNADSSLWMWPLSGDRITSSPA